MTGGIVDYLETIQIDKAQHAMLGDAFIQCLLQGVFKFAPVGQAGQRIMGGVIAQLLLHGPAGAHITKHHHRPSHVTVGGFHRGCRILDFIATAIAAQQKTVLAQKAHVATAQGHSNGIGRCWPPLFITELQHRIHRRTLGIPFPPAS